ncbi:hypothetical protein RC62_606 [Flavobacterium aquidurense]|uniref:Uncharacterized protein n=2 Tax=Flavobacterium aquidurense TaxID=362413 RepID=A0A0Q0W0G9_9FLAO|nr:hypothetical protein RC62_606 [Flavobacterium aquidurense]
MKKLVLYTVVILAFCNCQNKKETKNINPENIKDINQIVEAIIIQDSLKVFSKSEDSIMFCSELRKLNIYIPPSNNPDYILIPRLDGMYITQLIPGIIKGITFFSSKDSLHLLDQNSNPEKLRIEKNIITKLNSTTIEKIKIRRKNKKRSRFYEMTIPVFSVDRKCAYVQLDYQCGGLCGSGQAIYLKKIKGKWQNWIG